MLIFTYQVSKPLNIDDLLMILKSFNKVVSEIKETEIELSVKYLINEGVLLRNGENKINLKVKSESSTIMDRVLFFRYILNGIIPIYALGCDSYDKMI